METKRLAIGFGWGVVATIAMSVLMILGVVTGLSPMPSPIPEAIVNKGLELFGVGLPGLLIMLLAAGAHLSYGGVAGAILAALTRPVTLWKGLGWSVLLWLVMQVAVFPFLGWGLFGVAITPLIAVATLVLHLVYGTTLGLLMDRGRK
jgi:hypothetical protein